MVISSAEVAAWVGSFIWPLVRIAALLSVAPVFGAQVLPRRVRLVLIMALTWAVLPFIPPAPAVEPISPEGLLITAQQVLIGLSMGFILRLAFAVLELGGHLIAMQMGLGFATLVDPQNNGQMPLVSHFYHLIGILVFLALNGHLLLLQMLVESLRLIPVGSGGLLPADLWTLVGWASRMFAWAVLIALPAVASLLVVNLAFGVMTRAAPQFNVFAVGFPITLMLGLLIMLYSLPVVLPQLQQLLDEAFQISWRILDGGGG